jgi:hypothetical protein
MQRCDGVKTDLLSIKKLLKLTGDRAYNDPLDSPGREGLVQSRLKEEDVSLMRMLRKGQMRGRLQLPGVEREVWQVEKQFGIHNPKYAETWWKMINDDLHLYHRSSDSTSSERTVFKWPMENDRERLIQSSLMPMRLQQNTWANTLL